MEKNLGLGLRQAFKACDNGNPDALNDYIANHVIPILPHGSGIDCAWQHTDTLKNGSVILCNSYHGMDDNGYYDGWQDFYVKLFQHTTDKFNPLKGPCEGKVQVIHRKGDIDFSLRFTGYKQSTSKNWVYGLKDYLAESVHYALSEYGILSNRRETIDAKESNHAYRKGLPKRY